MELLVTYALKYVFSVRIQEKINTTFVVVVEGRN